MAANKTVAGAESVAEFLAGACKAERHADAQVLSEIMREATGEAPRMWGATIVGCGSYHYKYDSGREGDAPLVGFSPRKDVFVIYFGSGFGGLDTLLAKLGKHTTGASCLYIKKLAHVDQRVLRQIVEASIAAVREKYPPAQSGGAASVRPSRPRGATRRKSSP